MYLTKALLLLILAVMGACSKRVPFYRRDYTYIEEFDTFYKLHENGNTWTSAFETCDLEGARLFYPTTTEEATVLQILAATAPWNVSNVILGLRDDFHLGQFITIDGQTTPLPILPENEQTLTVTGSKCVLMDVNGNYEEGNCDQNASFICKKTDETPCPTIDKKYIYQSATEKCYKVNTHLKTWRDALETCFNEGALLVVIDNNSETKIVGDMITPNTNYYMGVYRMVAGQSLFTVKGVRLDDEDYYQSWYGNKEKDCGTLFPYNSAVAYNTVDCDLLLPFVCEMKTKP